MKDLKKINGEFSELIPNKAGILSKTEDAKEVRDAHQLWKQESKKTKAKKTVQASYWQNASACSAL